MFVLLFVMIVMLKWVLGRESEMVHTSDNPEPSLRREGGEKWTY